MPYKSIKELPPAVRDSLPSGAQSIFMEAFNAAYEGNCNHQDSCASRIAWTAVKNKFHKNDEGVWVKNSIGGNNVQGKEEGQREEKVTAFTSRAIRERQHEAILHMLDRTMPGDEDGSRPPIHYPTAGFESTLDSWAGTPIVFGPEHPDLTAFDTNPEEACKAVNGRIVGKVGNVWIDKKGHAKLMGLLHISDKEVEALFNDGRLSLSTGFYASAKDNAIVGNVRPNHILLFEENGGGTMPRDLGSQILNKVRPCQVTNAGANMPNQPQAPAEAGQGIAPGVLDRLKALFTEALQILEGKAPKTEESPVTAQKNTEEPKKSEDETMDEALKNQVEDLTKKFDALTQENTALKAKCEEAEKKLADVAKAESDAKWSNLKARLPTGLVDTVEKEAAERAKADADPMGYMLAMVNMKFENIGKKDGVADAPPAADAESQKYLDAKKTVDARMVRHTGTKRSN